MDGPLPPLAVMDVAGRADRLRATLNRLGVECLVVTKAVNIRWLTGFTGSNGIVAVTPDRLVVVTDGRYREQIAGQLAAAGVDADVEITITEIGAALDAAVGSATRVGLEAHDITWKRRDLMAGWLGSRELVPLDGPIEELRKVKDDGERSRLQRAAAIADRALAAVVPVLDEGPTERAVAQRLDAAMIDGGADEPSYDTIVASGPNGALPHARPTDRVIVEGDLVVIDVGARVDGYGSDMTRTFVVGRSASDEQRRLYEAVLAAQAAGVAAVAAGVDERQVDAVCRDALADRGLADAFIHGTGHGIGLEIHEDPILSTRSTGILRAGLVVTVEPGVYLSGLGGVRIEDSVIVGDDRCEPITHSPKTPVA